MKKIICLILINSSQLFSQSVDTFTLYYAYEKCSENNKLNCWGGQDGLFQDYFIAFDGSLNGLLTSNFYHWYSYNFSSFDQVNNIESRIYLDSIYEVQKSPQKFKFSNIDLGSYMYSYVQYHLTDSNKIIINYPHLDNWLEKKRNQAKLLKQGHDFDVFRFPNTHPFMQSNKQYYIFKVLATVIKLPKDSARKNIDYCKNKRLFFRYENKIIYNYYTINIFNISPVNTGVLFEDKSWFSHLIIR